MRNPENFKQNVLLYSVPSVFSVAEFRFCFFLHLCGKFL